MKTNVFVRHWNGSVSFDYHFMREFAKKEIEKAENRNTFLSLFFTFYSVCFSEKVGIV